MAKKYIITNKEDDRILKMCKELGVTENDYWLSILENEAIPNTFAYAYDADGQIADGGKKIGDPIEIPSGVVVEKWCYTAEDGFFENPDYEEPEAQ